MNASHQTDNNDSVPRSVLDPASSGDVPAANEGRATLGNISLLSRLGRRILPDSVAIPVRLALTAVLIPTRGSRIVRALSQHPVRLNLGSGKFPIRGWTNIDLAGVPSELPHNLMKGLPFPDGSVDVVFTEHFLEHFEFDVGTMIVRECYRVLRPGGVLRISVPDAGAYLRSYADDRSFIEENRPGRPTALLAVQELFYGHGHRAMYDFETLALVMREAGFEAIEERAYGQSRIDPCPDGEHRQLESLYVEALKPGAA